MALQIIRAKMKVLMVGVRKIGLSYLEKKSRILPYSIYKNKFQICSRLNFKRQNYKTNIMKNIFAKISLKKTNKFIYITMKEKRNTKYLMIIFVR